MVFLEAAVFTAVFRAVFFAVPFACLVAFFAVLGAVFAAFLAAFFASFFFFFATVAPPCFGPGPGSDHTIPMLAIEEEPRLSIVYHSGGVRIEIRPLVRNSGTRRRLLVLAAVILFAALFGGARLGSSWEAGVRKGDFGDLPLPVLVVLSLSVGVSTPLALLGLAALAFGEETIEVDRETIAIRTTAFERTRAQQIRREDLQCWRETLWPLPPWWTWSVRRLAARAAGRLHPLAGAASPKEKRAIGLALVKATQKPLVGDFGRIIKT